MLGARTKAGLSQADVAARMGTQAPAITRLESSLGSGKHSPSIDTLKRYAEAVGCELQLKFVRSSRSNNRFQPTSTPPLALRRGRG
ncbi:helix-turn-helix transcriptional regulator [Hydrocarboniphaga sp.]|uniref:helix-turn-helix domain-containing protein n=1 Tax=Hydrocarboniphaga sp. TaxID=2033016 RepID=UPI002619A485|nr:helix-turn-helix transcriptional regulator [Hydrocarboniphaga sp.]